MAKTIAKAGADVIVIGNLLEKEGFEAKPAAIVKAVIANSGRPVTLGTKKRNCGYQSGVEIISRKGLAMCHVVHVRP